MGKLADRYAWANKVARSYTPTKTHVNLDVWDQIRDNVVEISTRYFEESRCIPDSMNRADISFEPTVYQTMRVIAALMASGYEQGRTTPEEVFNERFILWYLDNSKITVNLQRTTRKYAILICEELFSGVNLEEIRDFKTPSHKRLPTYTSDEVLEFRQVGLEIGPESPRVSYLGALALTLGAGFNLKDMLAARGADFARTDGILTATVTDDYTRVVPVAQSWTDDLLALVDGVGPEEYVFYHGIEEHKRRGRLKIPLLMRHYKGDRGLPRFTTLRNTWLAGLINEGLDYETIAYLAGFPNTESVAHAAYRLEQAGPRDPRQEPLDPFMANRVVNLRSGVGL